MIFRLCADCWAVARHYSDHRAVGHPVNLRGTIHLVVPVILAQLWRKGPATQGGIR